MNTNLATLLVVSLSLTACSGDLVLDDAQALPTEQDTLEEISTEKSAFVATGHAEGMAAGQPLVVIWPHENGGWLQHGVGSVEGATFTIIIEGEPPEGLDIYAGRAVGRIVALPEGADTPDGTFDAGELAALVDQGLAFSSEPNGLIYRVPGAFIDESDVLAGWGAEFDEGYGCGRCAAPVPEGGGFGVYGPMSCDDLALTDSDQRCTW